MKREQRLRDNADFRRVREGAPRGWPHPLLVLYALPNSLDRSRVGFTVGKRVGTSAVVRNRVRRRLAEAVRLRYQRLTPGFDVVVIARAPAARATWEDLSHAVDITFGRARLWQAAPCAAIP